MRQNLSTFLRFSQRKVNIFNSPDIPGPSGGNGNGFTRVLNQAAVAPLPGPCHRRLCSKRASVSLAPSLESSRPSSVDPACWCNTEFPACPIPPDLTGGLTAQNLNGFSQLGRQATNPQFQNPLVWNPKFNYTRSMRRHSLKVGYEFQAIRTQVEDINPLYGRDTYNGGFSRPANGPSRRSQLRHRGLLVRPPQSIRAGELRGRQLPPASTLPLCAGRLSRYFQADLEPRPALGIRDAPLGTRQHPVELRSLHHTILRAKDGDLYSRTLVKPDYSNWGPRLGMAYNISKRTVLRGAYGISYIHNNRVGSADLLGINGPQVVIATVEQTPLLGNGSVNPDFRTTQQGYPTGLTNPANFNPVLSNIAYIPKDYRWPYVQTWFFSTQHEIFNDFILEVAYTGNRSLRLPVVADFNQALPNVGSAQLGIQPRRPLQSYGAITWFNPAGQSSYNGLSR
ncbi:MAG: hypothetical protein WDO18_19970 [Acidobacteriota bacterium]